MHSSTLIVCLVLASAPRAALSTSCPDQLTIEPGQCAVEHPRSRNCFCRPALSLSSAKSLSINNLPTDCAHVTLCGCPDGEGPVSLSAGVFAGPAASSVLKLMLQDCGIASIAEDSFSGLTALTSLLLDANQLAEDSLPAESIAAPLSNLQSLHMSSNRFKRVPNIRLPKHLNKLSLAANQLTECRLPELMRQSAGSLKSLTLSANAKLRKISSECLPSSLQALACKSLLLESMDLSSVSGSLSSLHFSLPALDEHSVDWKNVNPIDFYVALDSTKSLSKLSSLSLQRFHGDEILHCRNLHAYAWQQSIASIDFSDIEKLRIEAAGNSGCFSNLSNLKHLKLERCGLDNKAALTPLPADLMTLRLAGNNFNSIPEGLPIGLETLDLDFNKLTSIQPAQLSHLTHLRHLSLHGNRIATPISCLCLPSLKQLSYLSAETAKTITPQAAARKSLEGCPCKSESTATATDNLTGSHATVIGIVIGVFIALLLGVAVALVLCRKNRTICRQGSVGSGRTNRRRDGRYHSNNIYDGNGNNNHDRGSLGSDAQLNNHESIRLNNYGVASAAAAPALLRRPLPQPGAAERRPEQGDETSDDEADADQAEEAAYEALAPLAQGQESPFLIVCCPENRQKFFADSWLAKPDSDKFFVACSSPELNEKFHNSRRVLIVVSNELINCTDLKEPLKRLLKNINAGNAEGCKVRVAIAPDTTDDVEFSRRLGSYCERLNRLRLAVGFLVNFPLNPAQLAAELDSQAESIV